MELKAACRFCGAPLTTTMVDLGMHPLCETFPLADSDAMEPFYPLHVRVCGSCFLAQIGEYVAPEEIFDEYAYFSSFSQSWLDHAQNYVEMMVQRFGVSDKSKVLEIASNDGYLLRFFKEKGVEVLGVEPSGNVAEAAEAIGIESIRDFFGESLATRLRGDGYRADVVLGNNVLAHTPDINGFVAGIPLVLADEGVATFEFPHIMRLIDQNQFDTIYHEHWSYLSLGTVQKVFAKHGLTVFDVEELGTHGGSLRVFARHDRDESKPVSSNVGEMISREDLFGLRNLTTYEGFGERVKATKRKLLRTLVEIKDEGRSIAIYGAAGKGNTLLNYCGIGTDFIDYACDMNPYKHGRVTPGTHIPIFAPEKIAETRPDYVLILPWNIKAEIMDQLSYIGDWGGRFIVPIPEAAILEPVTA